MLSFFGRKVLANQSFCKYVVLRTFLSKAYSCDDLWQKRVQKPIFQKIDYDDLFYQLDRSFQIGLRISVLDVDLFVNGINKDTFTNELEDVLFKLRLNPENALVSDRTMHAVCRYYMSINKEKELINVLSNRLTFGVFPDHYISNMLMDKFLKSGDTVSAAKIAVLQMLQEDFDHPILRPLSLLSCYKYLCSDSVWELPTQVKEQEDDDDEDEVKIRVRYLRAPYHDDHFDIVNPNQLIGKTLHLCGSVHSGPLGTSSQIIGNVLHGKFDVANELLKNITTQKGHVHKEAIVKAEEYTNAMPKQQENVEVQESEELQRKKNEFLECLAAARNQANLLDGKLDEEATEDVKNAVKKHESEDVLNLSKLYQFWEKERDSHIQQEVFENKKKKIAEDINQTKEDLGKEEEMIFFFDKEDEWDLKVQEKEKEIQSATTQTVIKKAAEDEYIPPQVGQKRN